MAKPLKILLIVVGAIVGLFVVVAIAFAVFFDPNAFRGKISGEVKESTGRELTIAGDIGITFFPWLGVKLSQVTLGNAPGFGPEPFAQIGEAQVSVQLMPLIRDREVKASTITLQGLTLNLAKNAQGKNNWDDLSGKSETKTTTTSTSSKPSTFEVAGLDIKDAALSYADAQAKKSYKVEHLDFKTGKLKPGKPVDLNAKLTLASTDPAMTADVKLDGTIDADTEAKHYLVKKLKLDVGAQGAGVPGGKQDVKLTGEVDLDQAKGTLKFSDGKIEVAGLTLTTAIDGKNMNGDAPTFSGPLTIATFNPRSVLEKMQIKIPEPSDSSALKEASFNANLAATNKSASLSDVRIKLDQSNLTGRIDVRDFEKSAIEFALKLDQIDADRYLAPKPPKSEKPAAPPPGQQNFNSTEIPIKTLDAYNAQGSLAIGSLKLDGLQLADANMKIALAKGGPKSDEITAKLYGGTLQSHTVLTPSNPPRVASKATVSNISVGPLLKDMIGKDWLTGTGDLSFDINSSGRTVADVRHALAGDVGFNLANGAIRGVNIALIVRRAQALLKKQQLPPEDRGNQQTDFAELKGHGRIANGVLTTDTLSATNPAFRLSGEGSIDIGNERIDYLLKPTIVETSEGAGSTKELADLRGITIPIRVTGSFQDPKYTPDVEGIVREQAKAQLNKEIDKQLQKHGDKIGGALGDLLKRSLQKGQPQQPAQPQQPQQQPQTQPPPKNP